MHAVPDHIIGHRRGDGAPAGGLGAALRANPAFAVALLSLAATALRLHDIELDPFWKNELFSLYWIRHSFSFLATEGLLTETNPPLHFILLKLWTGLFGTGEYAVRSLSALASIACIPLIYEIGRRLATADDANAEGDRVGERVGLIAAGLLAVAPAQIFYAQEGRAYAFLPLFLLLALLGLCRFLSPAGTAKAWSGLVLYAGAAVALLYSHAIAVFILLALCLAVALTLADGERGKLHRFVVANLFVALFAAPQAFAMAVQARSPNIEWMEPFGLDTLIIANRYVMLGPMVRNDLGGHFSHVMLLIEMGLATVASAALLLAVRRSLPNRPAIALVLAFPLLFIVITSAVSMVRPILIPRVGVWLGVPICLAAAFVIVAGTGRLRLVAVGLMGACLGLGLWNNVLAPAQHKPHWRELARDNPAAAAAPILIAAPHAGALGLDFYGGDNGALGLPPPPVPRLWVPHPQTPVTLAERLERETTGATRIDTAEIAALIRDGRHVTLFADEDDRMLLQTMQAPLAAFGQMTRRDYPGLVVLSW